MKKDAYYFPHDSNAKDDPKCVLLIEQLGLEGYGIYWVLIETLRDQPDYSYPVALLPALARRYNTTPEKVKTVVAKYGLFAVRDETVFFSQALINRMAPLEEKRQLARQAGLQSARKRAQLNTGSTDVEQTLNDRSTIRVNKKRTEKSKTDQSKANHSTLVSGDTLNQKSQFFYNSLLPFVDTYGNEMIQQFYNYWSEPNPSKTKMRYELEKTWDTSRRLQNWKNRSNENGFRKISSTAIPTDTSGYSSTL